MSADLSRVLGLRRKDKQSIPGVHLAPGLKPQNPDLKPNTVLPQALVLNETDPNHCWAQAHDKRPWMLRF